MEFGEKLRQARLTRNMSQQDLSKATNLSVRSLYAYETQNIVPHSNNIRKLAEALDVSMLWLLSSREESVDDRPSGAELFLQSVTEKYGARSAQEAKSILERTAAFFAGGELDDEDKDLFFQSLTEAYMESRSEAKASFSPRARKKRKTGVPKNQ